MKKQKNSTFGIGKKLLIYFLIISLVPILIAGGISYSITKSQLKEDTKNHLSDLSRDCGRKISYFMSARYQDIKLLSQADVFEGKDISAMDEYIEEVFETYPFYSAISVIDANGKIIFCTNKLYIGDSRADRNWFKETIKLKQGDVYSLDVYLAETANRKMVVGFNTPIRDENIAKVVGVISTRASIDYIVKRILKLDNRITDISTVYIFNSRGEIITGSGNNEFLSTSKQVEYNTVMRLLKGKKGIINYKNAKGEKIISALYPLEGEGFFDGWGWTIIVTEPVSHAFKAAFLIRNILIIMTLIIIVLIIIAALFISGKLSKPIKKVSESAYKISQGKINPIPIKYSSNDEIGNLVKSFNKMTTDLNKTTVSRDILAEEIAERKIAEKALSKSEKQLREANITKDKFFSILAHDLRNPFTTLIGFSNILKTSYDDYSDKDRKKFIVQINDASEKTFKLLSNLLDWARIQSGSFEMHPRIIILSKIAEAEIELLSLQAKGKNINVLSTIANDQLVYADQNMTSTVFRNLISNAIKFTHKGGKVTISSVIKDNNIEVTISDTGKGISKNDNGKLFGIDEKHQTKGTANEQGSGLGLILCKEFIEKNKGKIWVESSLGKGSKFIFTLPLVITYK